MVGLTRTSLVALGAFSLLLVSGAAWANPGDSKIEIRLLTSHSGAQVSLYLQRVDTGVVEYYVPANEVEKKCESTTCTYYADIKADFYEGIDVDEDDLVHWVARVDTRAVPTQCLVQRIWVEVRDWGEHINAGPPWSIAGEVFWVYSTVEFTVDDD